MTLATVQSEYVHALYVSYLYSYLYGHVTLLLLCFYPSVGTYYPLYHESVRQQ